jgi:protein O-GlcNAc transferase
MPEARIPYRGCPLCEAPDPVEITVADCSGHPLFRPPLPREQRWMQCWQCAHIFVDGYFAPFALEVLFSSAQPGQVPGHEVEAQRIVWARVVDSVAALQAGLGGRWLDVGFGDGALLTTAAEYGYQVVGVDPRAENVRLMREAGYEAHASLFEDFRAGDPFDVVSLADALEHMPFPKSALHKARELLRPGGLLFLSMPNSDAHVWARLSAENANPYWGEIEHYHNFGRDRLYRLLEECGFRPARYSVSHRYRACMEVIARRVESASR